MEFMGIQIVTNPAVPADSMMMIRQDGDGIEVATPDGHRFFTWEEVRDLGLTILKQTKQ